MKRILVAVDGSEIGLAAVRAAAKLAAERSIPSVTLINVIPTVASTMGVTLLGSVSNRIVSHAPCSVLVVRPNDGNGS
jgi:nucleotide-binding universal stress UspA family protein